MHVVGVIGSRLEGFGSRQDVGNQSLVLGELVAPPHGGNELLVLPLSLRVPGARPGGRVEQRTPDLTAGSGTDTGLSRVDGDVAAALVAERESHTQHRADRSAVVTAAAAQVIVLTEPAQFLVELQRPQALDLDAGVKLNAGVADLSQAAVALVADDVEPLAVALEVAVVAVDVIHRGTLPAVQILAGGAVDGVPGLFRHQGGNESVVAGGDGEVAEGHPQPVLDHLDATKQGAVRQFDTATAHLLLVRLVDRDELLVNASTGQPPVSGGQLLVKLFAPVGADVQHQRLRNCDFGSRGGDAGGESTGHISSFHHVQRRRPEIYSASAKAFCSVTLSSSSPRGTFPAPSHTLHRRSDFVTPRAS